MSLFQEELERLRAETSEAGVSPEMVAEAGLSESLLPVPLSPIEKMMERDGKGKTFGKMLLGGMTGLTPFLMPELIGGRARYKAKLEHYYDQVEQRREAAKLRSMERRQEESFYAGKRRNSPPSPLRPMTPPRVPPMTASG